MKKATMPQIAGILNLVVGVPMLVVALVSVVGGVMTMGQDGGGSIFVVIAIIFAGLGVLPTLGGIYALRRKKWRLVLAGSIVGAILGWMLATAWLRMAAQALAGVPVAVVGMGGLLGLAIGIVATVFVVLAREEFT
ncbi:MAG: hypothetical protein ABIH70_00870 [Chloroflexota bacterium]